MCVQVQGKQEHIRTLGYGEENGQLVLVDRFELEAWEKKVQSLLLPLCCPLTATFFGSCQTQRVVFFLFFLFCVCSFSV